MDCDRCHSSNADDASFCSRCGHPLDRLSDAKASTLILEIPEDRLRRGAVFAERYEIIEKLGEGGIGRVYRVFDRKVEEEIAVKLLRPEIAAEPEIIARFRNELKFARRIIHKNVCRMFDLNESDGLLYLTMEYVPGEHLKSFIQRSGQLTVAKAVAAGLQIGEGLAEAHRLDVIHRDLKPQNIMVDRLGHVRIMDFGIARVPVSGKTSERGLLIGTPGYMSPEQLEGREPDRRSDIYALGLILYEMLTGEAPFRSDTFAGLSLKHRTEPPPSPRQRNSQVSAELESVVFKCLAKDPESRYARVEDVLVDLRRLQNSPESEDAPSLGAKPATDERETWLGDNSIAVLPFADLSPQKDQEYFCDSLSEEITNALAHIRSLRVAARTSSFYFKGRNLDIREVGKKLNVSLVLEGSVRKLGTKLRIMPQLINVSDGYQLWSERYDRDLEDIFAIQDEISLKIADTLRIRLGRDEKDKVVKRYTRDPEAYGLYLKGRFFWNKRSADSLERAAECFREAIEKDPEYALAHAGLAETYAMFQGYNLAPANEVCVKASASAERALALDPDLPEAHSARGFISFWYDWEWPKAEFHLREAVRLNPGYGTPHHWLGWFHTAMGRFAEAHREFHEALRNDPLSLPSNSSLGYSLFLEGRLNDAVDQLRSTVVLDANYPRTHYWLGQALAHRGDFEQAVMRMRAAVELAGQDPQYLAALGNVLARAGRIEEAESIGAKLEELASRRYVSSFDRAVLLAGLGNAERALEELEKSFSRRDGWIIYINVDPRFHALASEPRFRSLAGRIGLPIVRSTP